MSRVVLAGADEDLALRVKQAADGDVHLLPPGRLPSDPGRLFEQLVDGEVPDVLVIGHTDTMGEALANDELSAQRAERVKGFLIGIGIPGERIRIAGRGERELLVPTADEVDEPRNRRVEINVR